MNKSDLVTKVAAASGFTKKDITVVIDATFDEITKAMVSGEDVGITGFGKFKTTTRAAREGRNPQTGETIQIPEMKTPAFKASEFLKAAVKGE